MTTDPARIIRVGFVAPADEIASTSPAASSPPANATSVVDRSGNPVPAIATATTARCAPALTPSVSGAARSLRDTDWSSAPETPSATPTVRPAASRGSREPTSTSSTSGRACPVTSPSRSPSPTPDVPCVRCTAPSRTTRTPPPAMTATEWPRLPMIMKARPCRGPYEFSRSRKRQWARACTSSSANWAVESGPPNSQVPPFSACTCLSFTNGRLRQTRFLGSDVVNTLSTGAT